MSILYLISGTSMAKRQPGTSRTKQRRRDDADDAFLAGALDLGKWAQSNQQVITVLGVLLVIAVAGFIYYGNYRRSLNEQAAQQLENVYQSVAISDAQGARDQLVMFLERFGGTAYEAEGRLLLGELYLDARQQQQAIAVLEPTAARPSEPIEFQAAQLLAKAYEQDQRPQDAERLYLAIADRSDLEFQIVDALASAARIRAESDDPAGAVALYQRVMDRFESDDPRRGLFEMRIAELSAQANG